MKLSGGFRCFGIIVSTFTSTGGLSGAFLLLPFQVSILGFTGPAVTPTNLIFNIVAIPSGVYRYWKEKRMVWSLVWATMLGTLPGIILGAFIRIHFLQDPRAFKLFVGLVLLYIGGRLASDVIKKRVTSGQPACTSFHVSNQSFSLRQVRYEFEGVCYFAPTWGILGASSAFRLGYGRLDLVVGSHEPSDPAPGFLRFL